MLSAQLQCPDRAGHNAVAYHFQRTSVRKRILQGALPVNSRDRIEDEEWLCLIDRRGRVLCPTPINDRGNGLFREV